MSCMRLLAVSGLLLIGACADPVSAIQGESGTKLSGSWKGSIPIHDGAGEGENLDLKLELTKNDEVELWLINEGDWVEAKPGKFRISRHRSNAVIYATDSAEDDDGTWVETWVLVVTLRTPDELLVVWSRVVNNLDVPLTSEHSKFSSQAAGILKRVSSIQANKTYMDSSRK
jgi:hypothetical protein